MRLRIIKPWLALVMDVRRDIVPWYSAGSFLPLVFLVLGIERVYVDEMEKVIVANQLKKGYRN